MVFRKKPIFDWFEDQVNNGRKSQVRPLYYEDLRHMVKWPKGSAIEEAPFHDFPRDWASMEAWFSSRTRNPYRRTWTVLDERQRIIGRIGIVLVDLERKEGLLSIRLRADRIGEGYGYDSLIPMLNHWFITLQMNTMALDVSILNTRAIRLYEKLGFRLTGYHWVPIARDYIVPGISDSGFARYLDMQLDREDWQALAPTLSEAGDSGE